MVAVGGIGAVVVVHLTPEQPYLRYLPVVVRRRRSCSRSSTSSCGATDATRLVESVSGTVAGTLVAVAVGRLGRHGPHARAASRSSSSARSRSPSGRPSSRCTSPPWLGALRHERSPRPPPVPSAARSCPDIDSLAGALLGLAVGVLVATLHALFDELPSLERRWPSLAAVTLPVTVTGHLVYVVGRVLVG